MKSYLITDPTFYSSNPKIFLNRLLHKVETISPDFICIRDKITNNYKAIAVEVKKNIRQKKVFLHTDYMLAYELGFYGVHLPSNNFENIEKAKALGLKVIISTHTLKEAKKAEKLGADFITYSPIFDTPNKGTPKGLENLKEINGKININCFALGGIIDEEQIEACKKTGVYGFASIRYFMK